MTHEAVEKSRSGAHIANIDAWGVNVGDILCTKQGSTASSPTMFTEIDGQLSHSK